MLELPSHPAHHPARHSGAALLYNLATIAVFALLLAVGAAYLIDQMGRADNQPRAALGDGGPIVQTISGRELAVPQRWFRYGEQIRPGFTNQIDLRLFFTPDSAEPQTVDVTLLPRSRARTSASLLDRVYLHQFADETASGVPGLVGKPMRNQNGYSGETVWYDALSPNPFVAKCQNAVAPDAPAQCVRTVYLPSDIAAVYAFSSTLLPAWREFDTAMQRWLEPIGAW